MEKTPSYLISKSSKFQKLNIILVSIVIGVIFILYLMSASRAPESDNIGIIFVPVILFTIYGPAFSFICGLIESIVIKTLLNVNGLSKSKDNGYFSVFMGTQPSLFKFSGLAGLCILIMFGVMGGIRCLRFMIYLPFWALEYLF